MPHVRCGTDRPAVRTGRTDCPALLAAAVAYLHRHTASWSLERVRLVRERPELRAAEWAMDAACLARDVGALKAACRRWWAASLRY